MLSRGLTSLLDSGKNKAIAAAGPAAAAAPAAAAGGAAGAAPMPSKQLHSQVLAGGCETAKHHGWRTERPPKTCCPEAWRPFWILVKTKRLQLLGLLLLLLPAAAAVGAAGAAPMPSKQLHSQVLAGGCETAKHHGPEGRNDLQKHAAPRLDVPSGFC